MVNFTIKEVSEWKLLTLSYILQMRLCACNRHSNLPPSGDVFLIIIGRLRGRVKDDQFRSIAHTRQPVPAQSPADEQGCVLQFVQAGGILGENSLTGCDQSVSHNKRQSDLSAVCVAGYYEVKPCVCVPVDEFGSVG